MVTAGRIIVAPDEPVLRDGAVFVTREGKIGAVGPSTELLAKYSCDERLDFPTESVLPGLINAHVHLAFDATGNPAALMEHDQESIQAIIRSHARELLDEGVTTVRDLGDRDGRVAEMRDAIAAGDAVGPRILSSFAPLTSPKGHTWFLGGEVSHDSQIRAAIASHAEHGADLIKVMAGGGRTTQGSRPV